MGRRPNSNIVDLSRGSRRAAGSGRKDSKSDRAPKKVETPPKPSDLDKEEEKVWDEIIPLLEKQQILNHVDVLVIRTYVGLIARYRKYKFLLAVEGEFYETHSRNGAMVRKHPAVDLLIQTENQIKAFALEFGMTPASRSRAPGLQPGLFDDDDGWGEFSR